MADYVIVGAGSAGCVLAGRLSEDPDVDVLLLEAGAPDTAAELHVPAMFPLAFKSSLDWDLYGEEEPGLGGRRLYFPRGRVIGGSSSINAMIYLRGNRADFDEWAEMGCTGWSYDEVLPYFKRSEDNERGENEFHGVGGPLAVSDSRSMSPLIDAQLEAAAQAGYELIEDLNVDRPEGVSRFQLTQRNGMRCSAADAFLHPAEGGPNLEVRSGVFVERIVFEGDRAVGVELVRDGVRETVRAEREVIVSAGTYQSPVLLMLSGIGPRRTSASSGSPCARTCRSGTTCRTTAWSTSTTSPTSRVSSGSSRPRTSRSSRGGPRAAHLELPGGRRLLPDALGPAGAGRRVPLRGRALLRRGPHAAARQRLRVRAGDHQAHVARQGRPAHADGGLEADGALQLPHDRGGSREHARGRAHRARDRLAARAPGDRARAAERPGLGLRGGHLRLGQPREPDRVPPHVDLRDGRRRRRRAARLRRRGASRGRRLRDADDHPGEHERGDDDDRGEGGGHDPRAPLAPAAAAAT